MSATTTQDQLLISMRNDKAEATFFYLQDYCRI